MTDETGSSPRELDVEVLRTARVALAGADGADSTWLVLHGYRQLASRFLRRFEGIAGPGRLVVAPEAMSRFYLAPGDRPHGERDRVGASWMTRHERAAEIRDYVRYLDRVALQVAAGRASAGSPSAHRTVLGFSQGAHTAARWVALGATPPPDRLVLWGAGLPGDLPEHAAERLGGLELVRVRGDADPSRQAGEEEKEERLLADWGIRSPVLRHPGGHEIDGALLEELAGGEGTRG